MSADFSFKIALVSIDSLDDSGNKLILYYFPITAMNQILAKLLYRGLNSSNFVLIRRSQPNLWVLLINRAGVPIYWQSLAISVVDTRYVPAVNFPVLLLRFSTFIDDFSIKNSCGKSSIPRCLGLLRDLNKRFPFCNIQSKSEESHMLVDLNNVLQSDIHECCISINISCQMWPWWWVAWTTITILVSKLLNPFMYNFVKLSNIL